MNRLNIFVSCLVATLFAILVYLDVQISQSTVNVLSDGQAGIGLGIFVTIVQIVRALVFLIALIFIVISFIRRNKISKYNFINFTLLAVLIIYGFLIL